MFYYLIYSSNSVTPMLEHELLDFLCAFRQYNLMHGITGMLLYIDGDFLNHSGGHFIQVIEGEENTVKQLFEKIKSDDRHQKIILLAEENIRTRNFTKWSMGFEFIAKDRQFDGAFLLTNKFLTATSGKKINTPLLFLKSFYSMKKPSYNVKPSILQGINKNSDTNLSILIL